MKMRQNYVLLQSQAHQLGQQASGSEELFREGDLTERWMRETELIRSFRILGGQVLSKRKKLPGCHQSKGTVRARVLRDVKRLLKLGFAGNRQTCVACRK